MYFTSYCASLSLSNTYFINTNTPQNPNRPSYGLIPHKPSWTLIYPNRPNPSYLYSYYLVFILLVQGIFYITSLHKKTKARGLRVNWISAFYYIYYWLCNSLNKKNCAQGILRNWENNCAVCANRNSANSNCANRNLTNEQHENVQQVLQIVSI